MDVLSISDYNNDWNRRKASTTHSIEYREKILRRAPKKNTKIFIAMAILSGIGSVYCYKNINIWSAAALCCASCFLGFVIYKIKTNDSGDEFIENIAEFDLPKENKTSRMQYDSIKS